MKTAPHKRQAEAGRKGQAMKNKMKELAEFYGSDAHLDVIYIVSETLKREFVINDGELSQIREKGNLVWEKENLTWDNTPEPDRFQTITVTSTPVEIADGITLALVDGALEVKKNAPVAATT